MTASVREARARTVWCDDESLWVALADGRLLAGAGDRTAAG